MPTMSGAASLLFCLIATCLIAVTSSMSQLATPTTMTASSSISLYLDQIRISSVTCLQNSLCSLELWGQGIPEQSLQADRLAQYDIYKVDKQFRCSLDAERNDPSCCYEIMSRFNEQRETTNRGVLELLQDLNCSKIYCSSLRCGIIGCQAPDSCYDSPREGQKAPDTTSASPSPSVSSLVDPLIGIIIGCVVAFFAGVGGAVLITWLCRRKQSPSRERTPSSSNTETTSAGSIREDSMYEELPEGELKKKKSSQRTERVSLENDYTYIPDYNSYNAARPPLPATPASSSPATTTTAPTAIAYNVPGDHLTASHRKLPTAPGTPARHPAETADQNATRVGPETRGQNGPNGGVDHTTRGWVRSGGQPVNSAALATAGGGGGGRRGRGGDTSPLPWAEPQLLPQGTDPSADRPYFVLEEQQQQQQPHHQQQQLDPSSPRVTRPLPKPRLTVSNRPPLPNPREDTATVAAAGSISGPRGDYYSPLQAARDGDEEYTTLDRDYALGGGARLPSPPEYLELVEDYSLQKPVE